MRDDVRPLGVVYTPPAVAGPMVRLALDSLVCGRSVEELLALRICGPAIGEGGVLVEVSEVMEVSAEWGVEPPRRGSSHASRRAEPTHADRLERGPASETEGAART